MQSWAEFDRLEDRYYAGMLADYDREYEQEEEPRKYCVTWTYAGCKYEFDYYGELEEDEAFDAKELEFEFMYKVRNGKIKKGIPENIENIEILEVREIA